MVTKMTTIEQNQIKHQNLKVELKYQGKDTTMIKLNDNQTTKIK